MRLRLLDSVVVSTMISETKVFTCYEFPEWMRLFWLAWALLPSAVISITRVVRSMWVDFIVGLLFIGGLFLPVEMAAG